MIDLHNHLLPGVDDGARDLEQSLAMAALWVADGVTTVACTPHILPGVYANTGPAIIEATAWLQKEFDDRGVPLHVVAGADNHVVQGFVAKLRSGELLPIAGTRYVLVEPPHHIPPPNLKGLFFEIMVAGYVPILTHPERLTWIETHYGMMRELAASGVWMQLTAGSLTGSFGSAAKYWAERLLSEGLAHIVASDAHDSERRRPMLGAARDVALRFVGQDEARHLVFTRPLGVLNNVPPSSLPVPDRSVAPVGVDPAVAASHDPYGGSNADNGSGGRLVGRLRGLFQ